MGHKVKFVYFAWVRERVGVPDEILEIPEDATTGAEIIAWLKARGDNYAMAFDDAHAIRMAVNQEHVEASEPIGTAREIAFFPPMTGG